MMMENIGAIDAGDQLKQISAIALAVATVMAPSEKQGPLRREMKRILKSAFPEIKIDG